MELGGLPLAFPLSDPLAAACWDGARAYDDRMLARLTPFRETLTLQLQLPSSESQLDCHLRSVSLRCELSAAGRLASTLLERLPDLDALDALALPHSFAILEALVAPSRAKLAQHIRRELQREEIADVDEQRIVDLLRGEGLFAELATRSLSELQGTVGISPGAVLRSLGPLSDAGLLQRGRAVTCPLCNTPDFRRLAELDERVTCRACRKEFPLPAVQREREAPTSYRLDGFLARAMDQDVIPVLLTLRHFLRRPEARGFGQWWPGLDLYGGDPPLRVAEIDLLFTENQEIFVCEVKKNAANLTAQEAREHCELAIRMGARPVLAAAAAVGEWRTEVCELFETYDVLALSPSDLIDEPTEG